jgi:hypothetical protein
MTASGSDHLLADASASGDRLAYEKRAAESAPAADAEHAAS